MHDGQEASDESLLERTRRGEEAAFLQLYERHRDATFRFAYRMLGSSEKAEDVTHDCFVSLMRDPGRFDPCRASLRTYLYSAARNLAFKQVRDTANEIALEGWEEAESSNPADGPLRGLLARELSEEIQAAITQMPPLQREVVVLFEYEEQSLAEIAAIVGADVGTVKSRLHRARARLRRVLAPYLNGGARNRKEESNHEG
jgi:RNA polymerase sigma-70 factor (ECF subfamily)